MHLPALLLGFCLAWGDDPLASELPRLKATEPADALATFRVQPGFQLIQVAAEPLVTDPVAACFDADQRLYVVEMGDYPFRSNAPNGRVRLLEDRNNDGTYDHSTVFLDQLAWPTAIVPHDGGVFIGAAPDLIFAKDTDGDGKADTREVVFTGFGIGNVQTLFNGLLWGLDGWIYGSSGGGGGEITRPGHADFKPVSIRGRDFRFRPDLSAFEAISGGGQNGHAFDDWGHRFVCNNSNHVREIVLESRYLARNPDLAAPAILDIAAEGPAARVFRISPAEPWRLVRTRQRAADPEFVKRAAATELVPVGFFTSATGVTVYRGSALGPDVRGNVFVGDVGGNLVHRKRLEVSGSRFKATRADEGVEFIASTDNWFRPVTFVNTPDGTLLVLDMYREAIEHPDSIPEPIKKHLDLTSGKDRGRLYNLAPARFRKRSPLPLSTATTSELVNLLGDADSYWRETAQRLLVAKPDRDTIPLLRSLVQSTDNALAKLHALWTLENLNALRFEDVKRAVNDPEPRLRENAARLLEILLPDSPEAEAALITLSNDADSLVRFQAALALGGAKSEASIAALRAIALRDMNDPILRSAILSGLSDSERTKAFFSAGDFVQSALTARPLPTEWLEWMALVGARDPAQPAEGILHLATLSESGILDPEAVRAVLRGTRSGLRARGKTFADFVAELKPEDVGSVAKAAEARVVSKGKGGTGEPNAGEKGNALLWGRLGAMTTLALFAPKRAVEVLPTLLGHNEPEPIQLGALEALALTEDPGVPAALLEHWAGLGPTIKNEAAELILATKPGMEAALDAIEGGRLPASEIEPARRAQLLNHPDAQVRGRAAALFKATATRRAEVLARFDSALQLPGDLTRGREVYRKVCSTCHRAQNEGSVVGPDLATVATRTPENLLMQILDPNREVATPYVSYVVATNDGRIHTGIIAEEGPNAITLRRAARESEVINRRDVEEIRSTGLSLMPEDLEKQLDAQAVADVITYLRSLGASP